MELLDVRSATVLGFDDSHLHDLDGGRTSSVSGPHVSIYRGNEISHHRQISTNLKSIVMRTTCLCTYIPREREEERMRERERGGGG